MPLSPSLSWVPSASWSLSRPAPTPAPFHPIRSRLLRRVDRGTLNARHTDALLAPPSGAATICSFCSSSSYRGRPPARPRRFAAARPALTRSVISARSNCANEPKTLNRNSPWGVVVSIFSVIERNATPRLFNSVMIVRRCDSERPRRSSFQTIKMSPCRRSARQAFSPDYSPDGLFGGGERSLTL